MKFKKPTFVVLCAALLALVGICAGIARLCGISLWYETSAASSNTVQQQEAPVTHSETESEQELRAACPDLSAWNMVLVNKSTPVPEDYQLNLTTVDISASDDEVQFDARAADALKQMMDAGNAAGMDLCIVSTYRTIEYQEELYNRKIQQYRNQGKNEEDAVAVASTIVTPPGCSEHNIGLAADIVGQGYDTLDSGFEDTDAGKWLAAHCAEYGFILRYPEDKSEITDIIYEPWHFRYVGRDAASYITEHNLCLEEFIQQRSALEE